MWHCNFAGGTFKCISAIVCHQQIKVLDMFKNHCIIDKPHTEKPDPDTHFYL